jgi:uncharacterized membrane protein YuzA (DUF378 family)
MPSDTPIPRVSFSWREGRYFDLWMVVHFLSGVVGGLSNVFFGLADVQILGLGLVMMLLWEVGEAVKGIRESAANRVLDVIVGLAGAWAALAFTRITSASVAYVTLALTFVVATTLALLGARARQRRDLAG